jgi:hypothetical protein
VQYVLLVVVGGIKLTRKRTDLTIKESKA